MSRKVDSKSNCSEFDKLEYKAKEYTNRELNIAQK